MEIYPGSKITPTVKILWPDGPRWVTVAWVMLRAFDAWWDNASYYICNRCGLDMAVKSPDCAHNADCTPVWDDGMPEPRTLQEAIDLLEDLGLVTFADS